MARAVADGVAVDWEAATRDSRDDEERRIILNLRRLASLASVTRGHEAVPAEWRELQVLAPLGRGAFGDVFLAWDPRLEREVALKLVSLGASTADPRLLEEGRLLACVRHPNVVTVYGADASEGWAGIWMERIRGRTLASLLSEVGPLTLQQTVQVGMDVARALAAVHTAGILHCDVKPANVMIEEGGRAVLMDFGVGRRAAAPAAQTVGTPGFVAPEILCGEPVSVLSDIYGVGALLFSLVTGLAPDGKGACSMGDLRPDLPDSFVSVVERALNPDPASRWPSAGELAEALSSLSLATGRTKRHAWRLAAVSTTAALTAFVAVGAWQLLPARNRAGHESGDTPPATPGLTSTARRSMAPGPVGGAARQDKGDPFVPPVGIENRLSDALPTKPNSSLPFSVTATWHPQGSVAAIDLRASVTLSVYVLCDGGPARRALLFPLPGSGDRNPLAGDVSHRLPVAAPVAAGGVRILLIASPWPLAAFEAAVERSRVHVGADGVPLTGQALAELRRVDPVGTGRGGQRPLFEGAPTLASHAEIVQGLWIRSLPVPGARPAT